MADLTQPAIAEFLADLRQFYEESGRHAMAWRQPGPDGSYDPYKILVSELMLQQTQVVRVAPKYEAFIIRFPDVQSLAAASLGEVLTLWSGLGYNRRAKYLHLTAAAVAGNYSGLFPQSADELQKLPGVGPGTAGAIAAYAYDQPVVYLETNVRTVLIHHFIADTEGIPDQELRDILLRIITIESFHDYFTPREFYWALMDYGSSLKKSVGNLSRASAGFVKQSTFHGSRRQVRGQVLKLLTNQSLTIAALAEITPDERLDSVLVDLEKEHLITQKGGVYFLD